MKTIKKKTCHISGPLTGHLYGHHWIEGKCICGNIPFGYEDYNKLRTSPLPSSGPPLVVVSMIYVHIEVLKTRVNHAFSHFTISW